MPRSSSNLEELAELAATVLHTQYGSLSPHASLVTSSELLELMEVGGGLMVEAIELLAHG